MKFLIDQVGKLYGNQVWGLRDVTLRLRPGVTGLLGPNGAGKSTLMRILATITSPTQGRVLWNGRTLAHASHSLRSVLGYLPQDFGVYPHLNVTEFLEYLAALKGLDRQTARRRIDELLHIVNLVEARKRPLGSYSGGMKQRVGIAQALLNDPQVLIMDEPTVGLDPEERIHFRNLLADLSGTRIILLSTHIVSDVEAVATELVIISRGRMLIHDTPESLMRLVDKQVWEWTIPDSALPTVKERYLVSKTIRRGEHISLRLVAETPPHADALAVTPTVEDAYLYLVAGHTIGQQEPAPQAQQMNKHLGGKQ